MKLKTALICLFLMIFSFSCQKADPDAPMQPDMAKSMIKLKGYTADEAGLFSAVKLDDVVILKAFFDAGINPNAQNELGESLLTFAIQNVETKTVKVIIERADINLRDRYGNSPIHLALLKNKDEILNKLLEKNADVNVPGRDGKLQGQTVLYLAVARNREDLVQNFLERGANPNIADKDGFLPLAAACVGDGIKSSTVKMLLDKGADPNGKESNGATPLIYIAGNKYVTSEERREIVKMLLDKGADKTIKEKKGRTAFDVAKQFQIKDLDDLLK
ncbi:MAG TPA: ankyrin repeat domain-containing protein [Pyrinomonadaceae bacterium]|nr:ankyrin repeat domain-containing protein [Pyrinomonadaceae bacterium]